MAKLMQVQLCSCGKDIEVIDEYKVQFCQGCGRPIKPCAVCRTRDKGMFFDGCKTDCPFKSEYANALGRYIKNKNK